MRGCGWGRGLQVEGMGGGGGREVSAHFQLRLAGVADADLAAEATSVRHGEGIGGWAG